MEHIVIENAFVNFSDIKNEIIDGAKHLQRAQRGGPNGHSIKWFTENEIPITTKEIKKIVFQHISNFTDIPLNYSDVSYQYQFIEYNQPNDQYDWHIDGVPLNNGIKSRRITISFNLTSQNEDYIGGGFQLSKVKGFLDNENLSRVRASNYALALSETEMDILFNKNSIVIFNPDTIHRGSPIESGKRQLLTVWVYW